MHALCHEIFGKIGRFLAVFGVSMLDGGQSSVIGLLFPQHSPFASDPGSCVICIQALYFCLGVLVAV